MRKDTTTMTKAVRSIMLAIVLYFMNALPICAFSPGTTPSSTTTTTTTTTVAFHLHQCTTKCKLPQPRPRCRPFKRRPKPLFLSLEQDDDEANSLLLENDDTSLDRKQPSNMNSSNNNNNAQYDSSSEMMISTTTPIPTPAAASSSISKSMTTEQLMAAIGTSPRRIVLSFVSAGAIALGANFLGITSHLLEALPEQVVETTGLDTFYPRGDFKRFKSNEEGYTFVFPKEWVADTGLEVAKAQLRSKTLDLTMQKKTKRGILPDSAFGPPGRLNNRGVSSGDTNVSVIVSSVMAGFSLRGTLGDPTSAANQLLQTSLAPPSSGRVATLLHANEDVTRGGLYQFEYQVDRGERGPPLRAISVIAEQHGDTLLTLTVVAPKKDWDNVNYQSKLRTIADSFHVLYPLE